MDPQNTFCPNPDCQSRGQPGQGNIQVHSHKDKRFKCTTCGKTFAASKGTPFYRLHKPQELLVTVVTLLTHGCPLPAVELNVGRERRYFELAHRPCSGVSREQYDTVLRFHRVPPGVRGRPARR
jgi:transposase-like protein